MRQVSLCLPIEGNRILLGMKKVGFGKDKLNGFGGKQKEGETIEQTAVRELEEESGLQARIEDLRKMAEISFFFPEVVDGSWNQTVHVFLLDKWQGTPRESEEMGVEWHYLHNLPFDRMWSSDRYWYPHIIHGRKIRGTMYFSGKGESIKTYDFIPLS
jgi:8-oxo-dGTP pyrophosphatase MutT (NUDIX family)